MVLYGPLYPSGKHFADRATDGIDRPLGSRIRSYGSRHRRLEGKKPRCAAGPLGQLCRADQRPLRIGTLIRADLQTARIGRDTRALVAFFQSPLGSRYIAALAQITKETDVAAQTWAISIANDLLREKAAPNAAEGAPSNVTPQYPETEQTCAVRELIRVSGARTRARSISAQMILRLRENNLDDVLIQRAEQRLSSGEALSESWVPTYARHLAPEDARAMSIFFRTPVGRRWVEALPRIQEECLLAASNFANEASRGAIHEVLGPLPQWRLLHPMQASPGTVPSNSP